MFAYEDIPSHVMYCSTENLTSTHAQTCTMPRSSNELLGHLREFNLLVEALAGHFNWNHDVVKLIVMLSILYLTTFTDTHLFP